MPRRLIKRYLPDPEWIRSHKHLRFLGALLHDPNILHLNRRSVSGAFAVGLFMAFVPVPFQMVLGAVGAIVARVNLPISVALVWITNPLTMAPMYYFCYMVGAWALDTPPLDIAFEFTPEWLTSELAHIWQPFLLGCFLTSAGSALLGFATVRILWRLHVQRTWKQRVAKRIKAR